MAFNPKQAMNEEWRNWHEDYSHENGQYFCVCGDCGATFMGHKRRPICKACYMANLEQQNAELEVALKILASSPCETCPQAAGGLCHESDLVCAEARIKWAKQQAKDAE